MARVATRFSDYIRHVRPSWKSGDVKFSQITCALSNKIYCVSHGKEKLLLRIYGSVEHGLFSRETEVRRASFLASRGFGPQILHTFDEGRIESWLSGHTPSNEAMRSSDAVRAIAHKLRSMHDRTGLNHNDLHRNNMLFAADGSVELLDFEYCGSADPTYDIANHFNEWMYPYTGPNPHLYALGLYPSLTQRREFCASYLGHAGGKGAVVDDFLDQVERRRADSHAFWVDWAERSPNEFNDAYAEARRKLIPRATSSGVAGVHLPRQLVPGSGVGVLQDMAHTLGHLRTLLQPPAQVDSATPC